MAKIGQSVLAFLSACLFGLHLSRCSSLYGALFPADWAEEYRPTWVTRAVLYVGFGQLWDGFNQIRSGFRSHHGSSHLGSRPGLTPPRDHSRSLASGSEEHSALEQPASSRFLLIGLCRLTHRGRSRCPCRPLAGYGAFRVACVGITLFST